MTDIFVSQTNESTADVTPEYDHAAMLPRLVEHLLCVCEDVMTFWLEHVQGEDGAEPGNPYDQPQLFAGRVMMHTAVVDLFAPDAMYNELRRHVPICKNEIFEVSRWLEEALEPMLKEAGFQLVGIERHDDGTLSRIALQDPIYVAAVREFERALSGETPTLADDIQNEA